MNEPITIKDIAKELEISISTVSRALKNNPDIKEETRRRVQEYAKIHNYKPNIMAMNLRNQRSNIIGVIVPQLVHYYFSSILSGIENIAFKQGYQIITTQSNDQYDKEVDIVHSFIESRVCGVIASLAKGTSKYDHYQELIDNNIPVIFYDRICTGINTERVVVDDYAGSFAAVEYLIQTGCKRIFFYSAPLNLEISKNRRNGYLDAMKKYGIPVENSMIKICDTREQAIAITPNILEMPNRPDAFFAINDDTASGILYACKQQGLSIPEDVSICGFTDSFIAVSTDPKLTTVEQKGFDVGENAIEILLQKLHSKPGEKIQNRIVRTNLVVRGTTK